ncbi:MAG: heavy-metal-associated domain-containing protein [Sulfurovum sp.]|nr:heavy-metal-associated domain-containing protein [Sulfurovum sp.]MCB4759519.1 heavy-metal-associated domain-containing protein [Sulfurovum sp.]
MIQIFKVQNVKCGGCAHTLKEKLRPLFGEVEVNLEKEPRQIMLDIEESQIETLSKILKEMGYPFVGEKMGFMESGSAKAKSFISCAIGKINQ